MASPLVPFVLLSGTPVNGEDAVHRITVTGSPTSGSFTLALDGHETGNIAWNATATEIQTALEALENVDVGDVHVTSSGGALPGALIDVRYQNGWGGMPVTALVPDFSGLAGGVSPEVVISEPVTGVNAMLKVS